MDETVSALIQCAAILFFIIDAIVAAFAVIRFVRRVHRKIGEPAFSLLGKKVFLHWTWFVFIPLLLVTFLASTVMSILTRNLWLGLGILAFGSGIAIFVWLMWAIIPALEETVRKSLEP